MTRHSFDVPAGTLSYVDEGTGPRCIVFVHGNPSSSHEFDDIIHAMKGEARCIAPDHIGFGQSDKPVDWDYLPQSHAENLAHLLDALDLRSVTLVVGDWGGPIALSWALDHADRIDRVVITNTWMWSVEHDAYYRNFSWFAGGPIGRFLTTHMNFFARVVTRQAWGRARPLTRDLHRQFTEVHPVKAERKGMWVFPQQIIGASDWLRGLWDRRSALESVDLQIVWGMRDIAFREDVLEHWLAAFPGRRVTRLPQTGHFVALERPEAVIDALRHPLG